MVIITDMQTLDRLTTQFVQPELSYSRTVNIGTIDLLNRNEPDRHILGGSTEMTLTIDLCKYADTDTVYDRVQWLIDRATIQPNDTTKRVKVYLGGLFTNDLFIISAVNPKFTIMRNEQYTQAFVEVTFLKVLNNG